MVLMTVCSLNCMTRTNHKSGHAEGIHCSHKLPVSRQDQKCFSVVFRRKSDWTTQQLLTNLTGEKSPKTLCDKECFVARKMFCIETLKVESTSQRCVFSKAWACCDDPSERLRQKNICSVLNFPWKVVLFTIQFTNTNKNGDKISLPLFSLFDKHVTTACIAHVTVPKDERCFKAIRS